MEPHPLHEPTSLTRWLGRVFERIEVAVYSTLGLLLFAAAVFALVTAGIELAGAVTGGNGADSVFEVIDQLLFVLMMVEILHTVRVSIRSGVLTAEPFLIVGLIALIRRVLLVTLETSQITRDQNWTDAKEGIFRASMIELGVSSVLILVLVCSIWMVRRMGDTST